MSSASWISGGISLSIDRQPETWKPPITTGKPGGAELAGEIERVVELVRLDADQPDQRLRAALA